MTEKIKPTNEKVKVYREEYANSPVNERNSMSYGYVFRTDSGEIEKCHCIRTGGTWKFLTDTCYPIYTPDGRYLGFHDKSCTGKYAYRKI